MNSPPAQPADEALTVSAISLLAAILASIVHEGLGHAATDLLTGAESGLLTTVSWSSAQESRLVAAAGTLANLAAALFFWLALRSATPLSVRWRFFFSYVWPSISSTAPAFSFSPGSPISGFGRP